ncbi:hypothetical protein ACFY0G_44275 [Streptomyces sp. NPDC001552]|uniref:hypothetical protein n=1 Tax=Streptomyces sp. NPDC001552 TaxID=3364587 RepID=UPI00367D9385
MQDGGRSATQLPGIVLALSATSSSGGALPWRMMIAYPGPAKTMISPVATISLVAVTFSWST